MSKIRKNTKGATGKTVGAILALCLVVAGGVSLAAFTSGTDKQGETTTTTIGDDQQVAERVTGVPDTRTTSAQQTTTAKTSATQATQDTKKLFVLPGSNAVSKAFGGSEPMYSATMGDWRCHNGADFSGNDGMTVKAIAEGTVKSVSEDAAWGGVVVIDHGFGVQSRYCGVTASVKVGDTVQVGDKIGTLSGVPCESADGCHLHLEITVSGVYADPIKTIGKEVKYIKEES